MRWIVPHVPVGLPSLLASYLFLLPLLGEISWSPGYTQDPRVHNRVARNTYLPAMYTHVVYLHARLSVLMHSSLESIVVYTPVGYTRAYLVYTDRVYQIIPYSSYTDCVCTWVGYTNVYTHDVNCPTCSQCTHFECTCVMCTYVDVHSIHGHISYTQIVYTRSSLTVRTQTVYALNLGTLTCLLMRWTVSHVHNVHTSSVPEYVYVRWCTQYT
jgi:hypothetical protein